MPGTPRTSSPARRSGPCSAASSKVSIKGEDAYVNESKIVDTDIKATNGVIHVIDAVLMP